MDPPAIDLVSGLSCCTGFLLLGIFLGLLVLWMDKPKLKPRDEPCVIECKWAVIGYCNRQPEWKVRKVMFRNGMAEGYVACRVYAHDSYEEAVDDLANKLRVTREREQRRRKPR